MYGQIHALQTLYPDIGSSFAQLSVKMHRTLDTAPSVAKSSDPYSATPLTGRGDAISSLFTGDVYKSSILPLLLVTALLGWVTRPKLGGACSADGSASRDDAALTERKFRKFRGQYLLVWAFVIAADWLQGPYVYALYDSYGYSPNAIAQLFVAGFGSSMIFGTFVGSLADACGRKRCAQLYCVLYMASCVTKHCSIYSILMVGRVLGGIATSLLFSAFECWMVAECKERHNFSDDLLRYMFSAMFFVQYLVAILCGFMAQAAADSLPLKRLPGYDTIFYGGYTSPFDLSFIVLAFSVPLIAKSWGENYGTNSNTTGGQSILASLFETCKVLMSSWQMCLVGVVVAAFEGSMYCFVLNWTPALEPEGAAVPPFGTIFALFMMACMCGSSIFSLFDSGVNPVKVVLGACIAAAVSLGVTTFSVGKVNEIAIVFIAFLIFEACVGLYFPAIGTLKSQMVPESARAGVYNAFRIPLNLAVCGICLTSLSLREAFEVCSILMGTAVLALLAIWFSQDTDTASSDSKHNKGSSDL